MSAAHAEIAAGSIKEAVAAQAARSLLLASLQRASGDLADRSAGLHLLDTDQVQAFLDIARSIGDLSRKLRATYDQRQPHR